MNNALSSPTLSSMQRASPFDVYVIATVDTLGHLCGISMYDLYSSPKACITAFNEGIPKLKKLLGDDIPLIVPYTTPVIKYGHLNTLGIPLLFPETGQVALDMSNIGLEEIVTVLEKQKRKGTFSSELCDSQKEYLAIMREAFPKERVHWGWQWEGPLTTLWALSGIESMYAVYDEPELFKRCMHLVTDSIIEYTKFYCEVDHTHVLDPFPDHGRLCDDIAAMYSPDMWPEMVIPFWKQFYTAPIPAIKLHCEDMRPAHLTHLEELNLTDFDPGISLRLNPEILSQYPRIPFCWRLGSFHYPDMSLSSIHDFVYSAASCSAGYVFTVLEPIMCVSETIEKVRHLYHSGREVASLLHAGKKREELNKELIEEYPKGYWASWGGYSPT